jgi:RNA polymerase sigma factor (sigma-70 family)
MMISTPPESQDSQRAESAGGRAHFLQVFLSQRSQMEALVNRRVGCRATAADLVQDLFLRFWRRPLVQVEELSTYLLRCAGNIAIDHLRSEGARVRSNEGWLPEQQDNQGSEPQAALEAGNDLRHVEAALRSLPEHPADLPAEPHPRPQVRGNRQGHGPVPKCRGKTYDACPRSLQSQPS